MAVCTRCGVELIPEENWSAGQIKNRSKICKACNSAKGKAWYAANKERAAKNKNTLLSKNEEVAEARRAYRKRYYVEHKEHQDALVKKNYARYRTVPEHKARMMLAWIRIRAKRKNLSFDLDKQFILEKLRAGRCEVTGLEFDLEDKHKGSARINPFGPSVDRIDSGVGYLKTNCRMVVWIYNVAKQDFTDNDVMLLAKALTCREGEPYEASRAG